MEDFSQQLIKSIQEGDIAAFEVLYRKYYTFLCLVAERIVKSELDAEEIVSDVFVKLWRIKGKTGDIISIKAYLIKAVINTSINHLENKYQYNKFTDRLSINDYKLLIWDSDYPLGQLYKKEIIDLLKNGIDELPDSCKEIFLLSRDRNLKYSEISNKLGISINTVKSQMRIALARMREILKDYLV